METLVSATVPRGGPLGCRRLLAARNNDSHAWLCSCCRPRAASRGPAPSALGRACPQLPSPECWRISLLSMLLGKRAYHCSNLYFMITNDPEHFPMCLLTSRLAGIVNPLQWQLAGAFQPLPTDVQRKRRSSPFPRPDQVCSHDGNGNQDSQQMHLQLRAAPSQGRAQLLQGACIPRLPCWCPRSLWVPGLLLAPAASPGSS